MDYLPYVLQALKCFYQNDRSLLEPPTHEMSIVFRIAKYLADILEKDGENRRIDCEYHRMVNEEHELDRKVVDGRRIRPDIIYHVRSDVADEGENLFVIEVKIGSPRADVDKMKCMVNALIYKQGFCISNIEKENVTVWVFQKDIGELVKHEYCINEIETQSRAVVLEEKSNG